MNVSAITAAINARCCGSVRRLPDGDTHSMSSSQFNFPPEIAERVLAIGRMIPDSELAEDGRETEIHVTLKYGLSIDSPEMLADAVKGFPRRICEHASALPAPLESLRRKSRTATA